MITAWRMNEWDRIRIFFQKRYKTSSAQFFITMASTVLFDLTIAIIIGFGLSIILFVIRSSALEITISNIDERHQRGKNLTQEDTNIKLVYVTGQLFFGSKDRLVTTLNNTAEAGAHTIILSMRGVPSIDHSALVALEESYETLTDRGVRILFCGLQRQVEREFERSGFDLKVGRDTLFANAVEAIDSLS